MRRCVGPVLLLLGASSLAPRIAVAQRPDMRDPDFSRAVAALLAYDHLAAQCAASTGPATIDAAQVEAWHTTHRVDLLRVRLAELERDPGQREQVERARAAVVQTHGNPTPLACHAALQSTRRPEAQFATAAPRMLAALGNPPEGTTPATAAMATAEPAVAATPESAPAASSAAIDNATPAASRATLLEQVDSFGFDARARMGVGGFMALDVHPIVLFATGEALTDVTGLSFPAGLEAHKRANPDDWTRWRRAGGSLQLARERRWEKPALQSTYPRLPDGFRLDGFFRSLSGTGSPAAGGSVDVVAGSEYRFWSDGRVVRGGGARLPSEAGHAWVAASNVAPGRRGRYRIDGLMLHISYDDGAFESRMLIADPRDPKTPIWLDGVGYVRRPPPR